MWLMDTNRNAQGNYRATGMDCLPWCNMQQWRKDEQVYTLAPGIDLYLQEDARPLYLYWTARCSQPVLSPISRLEHLWKSTSLSMENRFLDLFVPYSPTLWTTWVWCKKTKVEAMACSLLVLYGQWSRFAARFWSHQRTAIFSVGHFGSVLGTPWSAKWCSSFNILVNQDHSWNIRDWEKMGLYVKECMFRFTTRQLWACRTAHSQFLSHRTDIVGDEAIHFLCARSGRNAVSDQMSYQGWGKEPKSLQQCIKRLNYFTQPPVDKRLVVADSSVPGRNLT